MCRALGFIGFKAHGSGFRGGCADSGLGAAGSKA